MKKLMASTIVLVFGLMLWLPALAQDSDESIEKKFSGAYELTLSKEQARKKIDRAIESVVAEMNFIKRPFARSALEDKTEPCTDLALAFPGDKISVTCDSKPATVSPADDTIVNYKAQDGETYKVSQKHSGRIVRQTFHGEEGKRINTMLLSEKGDTIEMSVRIESGRLPKPLEYELTFKKK
jgi:hypothetical protein